MSDELKNGQAASEYLRAGLAAMRSRFLAGSRSADALSCDASVTGDAALANDRAEAELHARARARAAAGEGFPLVWLRDRLGLSVTEERVVWMLLAHELDPACRRLLRDLNTEEVSDPTVDAIRRAVYGAGNLGAALAELAPTGRLLTLGLIERTDGDARCPAHRQTLALSRRVLTLALGDTDLDDSLAGFARMASDSPLLGELVLDADSVFALKTSLEIDHGLVVVTGSPGTGRRSALLALARDRRLSVVEVDCRGLATDPAQAENELRKLARECRLLALTPLLTHLEVLSSEGEARDRLLIAERSLDGLVVLATARRAPARRWQQPPRLIELEALPSSALAVLWSRAIPEASHGDASLMATMYPLAPALIMAVGTLAHRQAAGAPLHASHIAMGVRSVLDERLAGLATRIHISQSWDDLVLPSEQALAIRELIARVKQRSTVYEDWGFADKVGKGLGVSALLSGPPGTGKTMVAGLVARELGVELYQVDLSKIVSKWIGETERNLATLFDAAESGHAILLFDEADSLFGKRTDVKSSNDRHANQEVNYLLQRLESFRGVCLLTTNHEHGIDEAFRRRLSAHVRFSLPEADERQRLWHALLPAGAPVSANLNLAALAESYEMSGGYIRNAVLRAAFLAADGNQEISAPLLARAAQLEYEAMGKLVAAM